MNDIHMKSLMDNFDNKDDHVSHVELGEMTSSEFQGFSCSEKPIMAMDSCKTPPNGASDYNCDDLNSVCKDGASSVNDILSWSEMNDLTSGNLPPIKELQSQLFSQSNANIVSTLLTSDSDSFQHSLQQVADSISNGMINMASSSISDCIQDVKLDQLNYLNILSFEHQLDSSDLDDCSSNDASIPLLSEPSGQNILSITQDDISIPSSQMNLSKNDPLLNTYSFNHSNFQHFDVPIQKTDHNIVNNNSRTKDGSPPISNVEITDAVPSSNFSVTSPSISNFSHSRSLSTTTVPSIKNIITCPAPIQLLYVPENSPKQMDKPSIDSFIEQIVCQKCKLCSFLSLDKKVIEAHIREVHKNEVQRPSEVFGSVPNENCLASPKFVPKAVNTNKNAKEAPPTSSVTKNGNFSISISRGLFSSKVPHSNVIPASVAPVANSAKINSNTNLLKFLCSFCSQTFYSIQQLNVHLVGQHKVYLNLKTVVKKVNGTQKNVANKQIDQQPSISSVKPSITVSNVVCTTNFVPNQPNGSSLENGGGYDDKKMESTVCDDLSSPVDDSGSSCNELDASTLKISSRESAEVLGAAEESVDDAQVLDELEDCQMNTSNSIGAVENTESVIGPMRKKDTKKKTKAFTCNFRRCNASFLEEQNLIYHRKCHSNNKNVSGYTCPECNTSIEQWRNMITHLWKTHSIDLELYKCDFCDYKTWSFSRLYSCHRLIHGEARAFVCDICGKSFKNGKQMQNHKIIHSTNTKVRKPITNHKCEICGKSFRHRRILRLHKASVHENIRPYLCNYCGYCASSRSTLKMHLRMHTGEKPYSCNLCNYKTGDHNSLRRHKMIHSGEKPYKCPYCQYACIQSSTFKEHMKKKHLKEDVMVHSCKYCTFKAMRQTILETHMKRDHKDLVAKNGIILSEDKLAMEDSVSINLLPESDGRIMLTSKGKSGEIIKFIQLPDPGKIDASRIENNLQQIVSSSICTSDGAPAVSTTNPTSQPTSEELRFENYGLKIQPSPQIIYF